MFGEVVRALRRRLGLTQEELAARTGINVRTVGKLEANQITSPRPATVRLLADAFGLTGPERDYFMAAANPVLRPDPSTIDAPTAYLAANQATAGPFTPNPAAGLFSTGEAPHHFLSNTEGPFAPNATLLGGREQSGWLPEDQATVDLTASTPDQFPPGGLDRSGPPDNDGSTAGVGPGNPEDASMTDGGPVPAAPGRDASRPGEGLPDQAGQREATPLRPTPAQLPADVPGFTGRTEQLAALTALLDPDDPSPGPVIITAIGGTAGVGKTALAVHWAQQMRDRFPDGQLYVNLRGYDADRPMPATDALAGFLRALGLPGDTIPADVEERAALLRSLLDGRRVLLILDNASSVDQVRPLLPGSPTCVTVVTSRDSLGGLVARHGARRVDLDLLSLTESVALLRAMIGPRVSQEPDAAVALAEQCARLPLALRVAAELAAARPNTTLAALVAELSDERRRLALLDAGGDERTAIGAVFSWSYQNLPEPTARLFRRLGQRPGTDIDPYAAAALTDAGYDDVTLLLEQLTRAHLIHRTAAGRFGMHDLLRAYAKSLALRIDSTVDNEAALHRLLDYYVGSTAAAVTTLYPMDQRRPQNVTPASTPTPNLADADIAFDWLESELANLVRVTAYAAENGWPVHAVQVSGLLCPHLDLRGHLPEAHAIHTAGADGARRLGDGAAEGQSLAALGMAYGRRGWVAPAGPLFERVVELARAAGDRNTEGRALRNLSLVHWLQGRPAVALEYGYNVLDLQRTEGDVVALAQTQANMGAYLWRHGRSAEALELLADALAVLEREVHYHQVEALSTLVDIHCRHGRVELAMRLAERGLRMARAGRDRLGEAAALNDMGQVRTRLGEYEEAVDHFSRALALTEYSYGYGAARSIFRIGEVRRRQGRLDEAADLQHQALRRYRMMGQVISEAEVLNGLGATRLSQGRLDEAADLFHTARTASEACLLRHDLADALAGLGRVGEARGDAAQARHWWEQAVALYDELDVPADDLRILLDHAVPA